MSITINKVVGVNQPSYLSIGVCAFPFMSPAVDASGGRVMTMLSNNSVHGIMLVVPNPIKIHQVACRRTTGSTGHVDFGFYDLSGNQLVHIPFTTTGSTPTSFTTTITPYTLDPGVYYYCWAADAALGFAAQGTLDSDLCIILAAIGGITFVAANSAVAGVLPATLGALTSFDLNTSNQYPPTILVSA